MTANKDLLNHLDKHPSEIQPDDIKIYMAEKLSDKSASSTILFLAAIKYSHQAIFQNDPTSTIKRPKKEKRIPSVLTKEEVRRLIGSCYSEKSKLMISLIYACGFRVSEITNLKTIDLDFNEKIGHIRQGKGIKIGYLIIPDFIKRRSNFTI